VNVITNADQGVFASWTLETAPYSPNYGAQSARYYIAAVNGGNLIAQGTPQVPVQPILQAQDGTFYGTTPIQNSNGSNSVSIVKFDQSGNIQWSVPNDTPQIATADGGVIGASGITYDSNGRGTGMIANMPTYSWKGAYTDGPVQALAVDWPNISTVLSAFLGGSPTGGGTTVPIHSIGLFWCGNNISGTCQQPPIQEPDLGFDYFQWPATAPMYDFTSNSTWTGLIIGQAMNALKAAYAQFPVTVELASEHSTFFGGTAPDQDHIVYVNADSSQLKQLSMSCGLTNPFSTTTSFEYLPVIMSQAEIALGSLVNGTWQYFAPSWPTLQTDFAGLLTAVGKGVGNTAAHEVGHQFQLPNMDCSGPNSPACPFPDPPYVHYEQWSCYGFPPSQSSYPAQTQYLDIGS